MAENIYCEMKPKRWNSGGRIDDKHVSMAADMHTTEGLLEAVFSMWTMLRPYRESHREVSQPGFRSCEPSVMS
jgi:hypothetical protein